MPGVRVPCRVWELEKEIGEGGLTLLSFRRRNKDEEGRASNSNGSARSRRSKSGRDSGYIEGKPKGERYKGS